MQVLTLDSTTNKLMSHNVGKDDYQVVSKPSVANKAEANEENSRQSVLDKKLNKVKKLATEKTKAVDMSLDSARQENTKITELQAKLNKQKQEN